jgi:hypothetical protein
MALKPFALIRCLPVFEHHVTNRADSGKIATNLINFKVSVIL